MARLGLCGGTFDPFHRGHLEPVRAVRESMQWDEVVYVPASMQPFKQGRQRASAFHRFAMAVLATEEVAWMSVSALELERGGVSYTVETLEWFRREYRDVTIDWIIGDDNLEKLHQWKSVGRILEIANFAVLTRSAREAGDALSPDLSGICCSLESRPANGAVVFVENPVVAVSSTEIRTRVAAGEPIEDLVGGRVSRYIHHYALYGKGPS